MADNKHRGPTLDSFLDEEGIKWRALEQTIEEVRARFEDAAGGIGSPDRRGAVSATRAETRIANRSGAAAARHSVSVALLPKPQAVLARRVPIGWRGEDPHSGSPP
jgi:hypothetical protein